MNKAIKNILASILPQLVNIITNLVLPGLIIIRFGSEMNGLVSTTKTIISYISLVGAGIAAAVTQALYEPVAKKDNERIKGMLNAAGKMFNKYGLLFCLITIAVAFLYPIFIRAEIDYKIMVVLLIVMSLSGASEFFAIGRCRALLYANQQVYACMLIQAASLFIGFILAIIMLNLGMGILIVEFAISFVYVVRGVFLNAYVKKRYPELSNYKKTPPINDAINKRNDAMIHQLSGVIVAGSQAAVLSILVDLQAASVFAVYNIVFSGLQSICSNLSTAVTPFLGRVLASGDEKGLNRLYDLIEYAFFALVTFVYSVTAITILSFVSIYTEGADITYYYPLFAALFVLSSAFYILKLPSLSLINIAGHFKETKRYAIIETVLCVVISIVLTLSIGKEGVLIGTGLAMTWRCIVSIIYADKVILKRNHRISFSRFISVALVLGISCICAQFVQFAPSNYLQWLLLAMITCVIVGIVIVLEGVIFERKTLKYAISLFRK